MLQPQTLAIHNSKQKATWLYEAQQAPLSFGSKFVICIGLYKWDKGTTNLVTILHFFLSAAERHTLHIVVFKFHTVFAVQDMEDQAALVGNIRDY